MKSIRIYILTFGLLLACGSMAVGQERSFYRMERVKANNPWISAQNAAGLTNNQIEKFSIIQGEWKNESGEYRNIQDPYRFNLIGLNTESVLRVNKLFCYGKFDFGYNMQDSLAWTNVISRENTPIFIADGTPGLQTMESYHLDGGVGYPIGDNFAIGAKIDYRTISKAKHKDARNKNTMMDLNLYPSIMFRTGSLRVGANFIYQKMTESIDVKIIGSGKVHEVYEVQNLWHYKSYILTDLGLSVERNYQQESVGGALQIEFNNGKWSFFNNISIKERNQYSYPSEFSNERSGEIKERSYDYNGLLSFSCDRFSHYISLNAHVIDGRTYENIQQMEIIDMNEVWVQYGIKNKGALNRITADLNYHLFSNRSQYNSKWDLLAGVERTTSDEAYRLFPVRFVQRINNTNGYAAFNKNFLFDNGMLDCRVDLSYTLGDGRELYVEKESEVGSEPTKDQYSRLDNILKAEFEYLTSNRIGAGVNIRYTQFLNKEKGSTLYGNVKYGYTRSLSGEITGKSRNGIELLIGYTF